MDAVLKKKGGGGGSNVLCSGNYTERYHDDTISNMHSPRNRDMVDGEYIRCETGSFGYGNNGWGHGDVYGYYSLVCHVMKGKSMLSIDWKIHKKLLGAGGLGDTIYICQGRGSGKLETELRLIEDLQAKGKDVVLLSLNDMRETRTYKPGPVTDFDLLTDEERAARADSILNAIVKAHKELMKKAVYPPEYEMFKDFYVLDKTKNATPYLHWIKSNPYCATTYFKNEEG